MWNSANSIKWVLCGLLGFSSGLSCAGTLSGTAAYRERMALPPGAVFEAELQNVSRADAPAEVLGTAKLDPAGQPPFRFEIKYDDAAIKAGHRYTLRATVKHQGRLLFTTDRHYPVLKGTEKKFDLLLVSARSSSKPKPSVASTGALPASFQGELPGASNPVMWHLDLTPQGRYQLRLTHVGQPEPNRFDDIGLWTQDGATGSIVLRGGREAPVFLMPLQGGKAMRKLNLQGQPVLSGQPDRLERLETYTPIEPRLSVAGMFSYQADAASITLCADGRRLPVATDGDYQALEAAYLMARDASPSGAPKRPILVNSDGVIAQRPSMETGHRQRDTWVVDRFINVEAREACGTPLADSPLRGTYWKLVRLGAGPILAANPQREAHLLLETNALRAGGSGGCNRMGTIFELDGDQLRFGQTAGTKMACVGSMEQEKRFLDMLGQVQKYQIRGSHLEFLDAQGSVAARFEAVARK